MERQILLASIALTSVAPRVLQVTTKADIQHGFCGGDEDHFNIGDLAIDPYPVTVASGSSFNLAATIDLLKDVPIGTSIKLKVFQDGLMLPPIPCIEFNGISVGSCEYDVDSLLAAAEEALCGGGFFPAGQGCKLPLVPGQYGGGEPLTVILPDLPDLIIDLLAAGTYMVEIHANGADGALMVCAWVRLQFQRA